MPTEDEMTLNERRKYLKRMKPRYLKASRKERGQLLSEMEQVTGMHRKSLTRWLHASEDAQETAEATRAQLWSRSRRGDRAGVGKPGLHLCRTAHAGVTVDGATPGPLCCGEVERGDRRAVEEHQPGHRRSHLAPPSQSPPTLAAERSGASEPGDQRRADGTHPLGHQRAGARRGWTWCITVDPLSAESMGIPKRLVDVATGWSERVAVLGRGQRAMHAGFERILSRVPFAILELHPDNGS